MAAETLDPVRFRRFADDGLACTVPKRAPNRAYSHDIAASAREKKHDLAETGARFRFDSRNRIVGRPSGQQDGFDHFSGDAA